MKWKEGELVSEDVYQRALFDLDMARKLSRLEGGAVKHPAPPIGPCLKVGDKYELGIDLVLELRKYNIPKPVMMRFRLW